MERRKMIKTYWADHCPGHTNCASRRPVILKSNMRYLLQQAVFKYPPDSSSSLWQTSI